MPNMTTPPARLLDLLVPTGTYQLRLPDGQADGVVNYTNAVALAVAGLVEGVGPKSGTIRFLRHLPPTAQQEMGAIRTETHVRGARIDTARTNLGVYKQELTTGWTYAFCLLRQTGL